MTYFCMIIASVVGTWCYGAPAGLPLPGDCEDIGDIHICIVEAEELPIRPSYYDPYIVTDNPAIAETQCQEPCDLLGDGTPVVECYGRCSACVSGWYWRNVRVFWPDGTYFEQQCRDHGGDVYPRCGDVFTVDAAGNGKLEYQCYIPIDLLQREPMLGLLLLLDWEFVE